MTNDFEHTYECENCEGTFIIKPDMDEVVSHCPQCGVKNEFKSTFYIVDHDMEEDEPYDDA